MAVLEIYSKCLKVKYKSRLFSKGTLFTLIVSLVSIIVPFIFAYNSRGFWIKHDTFFEQPDIRFWGEYIFNAITNNVSSPIICSTLPSMYDYSFYDKCSLVKVREADNNKDEKVDELQFSLNIETQNLKIISFYLMLFIDYTLHTTCPLQMQSAIAVEQHLQMGVRTSEINIIGEVGLLQTSPLQCHPKWKNNQYNYSLSQDELGMHKLDINKIIINNSKRNISTILTNTHSTIRGNSDSEFTIKLKVRYPENKVYYLTGFWQILKWAWIQYFAIYVIVKYILEVVRKYVFDNRLVLFYEISPLQDKR